MSTGMMTVSSVSNVSQQEAGSTLGKTVGYAGIAATGTLLSNIGVDTYSTSKAVNVSWWNTFKSVIQEGTFWKNWGIKAGIAAAVVGGGYLLCKGISAMFSNKNNVEQ